jgi:DNA polymerase-3 subunit beta
MTATLSKKRSRPSGISLPTSTLRAALAAVKAAVPSRSPKPILSNVLLANGVITATDLELQVSADLAWSGDPLLLPHARLSAILAAATGDEVTIARDGTSCVVSVGDGRWTLPTEAAAEFPTWEPAGLKPICRIPADQFCRAVRAVVYATDNESSRYALGGVLVEMKAGVVTCVGTDGRRLATYEIEVDQATDDGTTLIPAKAIQAMAAAASHTDGAVQLEANASEVVATIDGTVITGRLVEGRFPRWREVFPERDVKPTIFHAPELLAATRQAAIVTSEQSKGVTFTITSEGLHLTARSSEAGESSVTCPVLEFGQAATVSLDPHFVIEFLRSVDEAEPAEIEAAGKGDAVFLRSGDCKAVIMPLAVD